MDCPVCLEGFDEAARRPKALPCGHATCLRCLAAFHQPRCSECRMAYPQPAAALPDCVPMMRLLRSGARVQQPQRPSPDWPGIVELDLQAYKRSDAHALTLITTHGVRCLKGVGFNWHLSAASRERHLRLLRVAAPSLEELHLKAFDPDFLAVVQRDMPRLKRLFVGNFYASSDSSASEGLVMALPRPSAAPAAAPPGAAPVAEPGADAAAAPDAGLETLCMESSAQRTMPLGLLEEFLRARCRGLKVLLLNSQHGYGVPLGPLLRGCGLTGLERIVVSRSFLGCSRRFDAPASCPCERVEAALAAIWPQAGIHVDVCTGGGSAGLFARI